MTIPQLTAAMMRASGTLIRVHGSRPQVTPPLRGSRIVTILISRSSALVSKRPSPSQKRTGAGLLWVFERTASVSVFKINEFRKDAEVFVQPMQNQPKASYEVKQKTGKDSSPGNSCKDSKDPMLHYAPSLV